MEKAVEREQREQRLPLPCYIPRLTEDSERKQCDQRYIRPQTSFPDVPFILVSVFELVRSCRSCSQGRSEGGEERRRRRKESGQAQEGEVNHGIQKRGEIGSRLFRGHKRK